MKLVEGLKVRQTGKAGATTYTLVSKGKRSSKWICHYVTPGHNIGLTTAEVRISVLELHRDFEEVLA